MIIVNSRKDIESYVGGQVFSCKQGVKPLLIDMLWCSLRVCTCWSTCTYNSVTVQGALSLVLWSRTGCTPTGDTMHQSFELCDNIIIIIIIIIAVTGSSYTGNYAGDTNSNCQLLLTFQLYQLPWQWQPSVWLVFSGE